MVRTAARMAGEESSSTMAMGALFGAVWAWLGYRSTGGQRDFTSVSQVVASRYEVLTEHKHAARARELLDAAERAGRA